MWVECPLCSLKAAFPVRRRLRLPSERSVHAAAKALHLSKPPGLWEEFLGGFRNPAAERPGDFQVARGGLEFTFWPCNR